jgi:hypothetical protein
MVLCAENGCASVNEEGHVGGEEKLTREEYAVVYVYGTAGISGIVDRLLDRAGVERFAVTDRIVGRFGHVKYGSRGNHAAGEIPCIVNADSIDEESCACGSGINKTGGAFDLICESKVPSGYGVRHLVFSKDGKYIYAVNELVPSISVFSWQNGGAKLIQTVGLSCKNQKASGAAIRLSENGKYLYVSLREENTICVFEVEREKLTLLQKIPCGGDSPRDFILFKEFLICCNEKSGDVVVFKINPDGFLQAGDTILVPQALCAIAEKD